jgi:mitogen-activated protein kinase 15
MSSIPNDESIDDNILLKYTIVTKMGSGAYGHVWKVIDKNNGQTYALKKVYSAFQNELDAERTYHEISILKKLQHPNVVKL